MSRDVPKASATVSQTKKTLAGLIIVCGIAGSWVGSTQLSESTYSADFQAPLFGVWLSTCWFVALFPLYALWQYTRVGDCWSATYGKCCRALFHHLSVVVRASPPAGLAWAAEPRHHHTHWHLARLAAPFLLLWMIANYCYVKALMYISATDVTAVFSIAPVLVAVFSVCFLREPMTVFRALAVVMTVAGVVLVALADDGHHTHAGNHSELPASKEWASSALNGSTVQHTVTGLVLTVWSGFAAAVYKVFLKTVVGDAPASAIFLHLSVIGLLNLIFLWPLWLTLKFAREDISILLHFVFICLGVRESGVETFAWKELPAGNLCGSGVLGLLFNFLINFGIALTFPLFISLGTVLGIPVNAVVDRFLRHVAISGMKIGGCVMLIIGFLVLTLERPLSRHKPALPGPPSPSFTTGSILSASDTAEDGTQPESNNARALTTKTGHTEEHQPLLDVQSVCDN